MLGAGRKVEEEVEKVEEEERKTFHRSPHHNVLIVQLSVRFREYCEASEESTKELVCLLGLLHKFHFLPRVRES